MQLSAAVSSSSRRIRGWSRSTPDGGACLLDRSRRTGEAIRAFSRTTRTVYPEFCATHGRLGAFLSPLLEMTPPSLDAPRPRELWDLLKTGPHGSARSARRMVPSAALGADGGRGSGRASGSRPICCRRRSPRAASSARRRDHGRRAPARVLLLNAAIDPAPGGSSVDGQGRPGALTAAMAEAAREAGAEIRTGAGVARVLVRDGRSPASCSTTGREISDATVDLERRSAADVSRPGRSGGARSGFHDEDPQLSVPRDGGQGQPRARRTCRLSRASRTAPTFTAAIHIGPERSTTSNARSTHRSTATCRRNRISTSRCRR